MTTHTLHLEPHQTLARDASGNVVVVDGPKWQTPNRPTRPPVFGVAPRHATHAETLHNFGIDTADLASGAVHIRQQRDTADSDDLGVILADRDTTLIALLAGGRQAGWNDDLTAEDAMQSARLLTASAGAIETHARQIELRKLRASIVVQIERLAVAAEAHDPLSRVGQSLIRESQHLAKVRDFIDARQSLRAREHATHVRRAHVARKRLSERATEAASRRTTIAATIRKRRQRKRARIAQSQARIMATVFAVARTSEV